MSNNIGRRGFFQALLGVGALRVTPPQEIKTIRVAFYGPDGEYRNSGPAEIFQDAKWCEGCFIQVQLHQNGRNAWPTKGLETP